MKHVWERAFDLLQKMGKALMLPVSVLPVAGILLGLGSARLIEIQKINEGILERAQFGWLPAGLAEIMKNSGDAIFANLPILFAIAVAIGYTANDGVSALAAIVGFVVFLATLGTASTLFFGLDPETLKPIMGIPSLDTGVFGGLIIGCVAAYMFNQFFRIKLPQYLGFFAGKRFVPIITAFAAIAVGILMSAVWPPIGNGINAFANAAAEGENIPVTVAIYGFIERLLIPFGLHHIWNVPIFFEVGSFQDPITGEIVRGDINRFFSGDPTAGIIGGAYWFKMFGLPAAAIAMWHCAKPKNRKQVGGIMISAALTSFLTGITEPIEFSFVFVAPVLFLLHAVLAGFADLLFTVLGGRMGFTFSHGFIDFFLFYRLGTKVWLIPAFAPLFIALYYFTFRFAIKSLNLQTPGREAEEITGEVATGLPRDAAEMAKELVLAFGGRSNIDSLDACITRLRISVKRMDRINVARLKALGAAGVLEIGNSAQAIFGPRSENLKTDMMEYLKTAGPEADRVEAPTPEAAMGVAAMGQAAAISSVESDPEAARKVADMINALGGRTNILTADAAALTRLRIEVIDSEPVDEEVLEAAGVEGILRLPGGKLHLLVGLNAEQYAREMKQQLQQQLASA